MAVRRRRVVVSGPTYLLQSQAPRTTFGVRIIAPEDRRLWMTGYQTASRYFPFPTVRRNRLSAFPAKVIRERNCRGIASCSGFPRKGKRQMIEGDSPEVSTKPVHPTRRMGVFAAAQPQSVTILPTYRCNAACAECCFESNPRIRHRMTRAEMLALIDRLPIDFPDLEFVVFSGGEVTLLREELIDAIARVTELNLGSRVVSNGHWGRSDRSAEWWVTQFRSAGLGELNLSTGDEHQQFVPFNSVARAAMHAVRAGLVTLISIEGSENARFQMDSFARQPLITEILQNPDLAKYFLLMTNVWMPFHSDTDITNDRQFGHSAKPCDNIFDNVAINPHGFIMSCCGLTMEYIPEIKVGHIDNDNMRRVYGEQYGDLLKLWIWIDGTQFIYDEVMTRLARRKSLLSPHMCSTCAQIYTDPVIRDMAMQLAGERAEQILLRATIKAQITGRLASNGREGLGGRTNRTGYPGRSASIEMEVGP